MFWLQIKCVAIVDKLFSAVVDFYSEIDTAHSTPCKMLNDKIANITIAVCVLKLKTDAIHNHIDYMFTVAKFGVIPTTPFMWRDSVGFYSGIHSNQITIAVSIATKQPPPVTQAAVPIFCQFFSPADPLSRNCIYTAVYNVLLCVYGYTREPARLPVALTLQLTCDD